MYNSAPEDTVQIPQRETTPTPAKTLTHCLAFHGHWLFAINAEYFTRSVYHYWLLTFRQVAHHVVMSARAPGALPEDSHSIRITAEGSDIFVHPPNGLCLVLQPVVSWTHCILCAQKSQWSKSVKQRP